MMGNDKQGQRIVGGMREGWRRKERIEDERGRMEERWKDGGGIEGLKRDGAGAEE